MDRDLVSILHTTGCLSEEQLARYFGLDPARLTLESWMLWHDGMLWDSRQFQSNRHRHHWTLRTEAYWALSPQLHAWQNEPPGDWLLRPDAICRLQEPDITIALEVDTGRETADQWRDKLHRYESAPDDWHLLVVAHGKRLRLHRLAEWLADRSPQPWALVSEEALATVTALTWHTPHRPPLETPRTSRTRAYYLPDDQPLPPEAAEQLLASGHWVIGAIDRQHQEERCYLRPQRRR